MTRTAVTLLVCAAVGGLAYNTAVLAAVHQQYFTAALVAGYALIAIFEFRMVRKENEEHAKAMADILLGAAMLLAVVVGQG